MRLRVLFTSLIAFALVATATPASACSCATGDPRDRLADSEAAFIGTLLARRLGPELGNATFTFRVDEDIKGTFDETEEVVSADNGASCGLEIEIGQATGLFLRSRTDGMWNSSLCEQISPRELRQASQPLPAPDGQGPIRMLAGGSWGEMGVLALDSEGRTLAYGERVEDTTALAMCPGSTRFLETYREERRKLVLAVRETSSLDVVGELDLPIGRRPYRALEQAGLACRSEDGSRAVLAGRRYGRRSITGFLFRITGDAVEKVYEGSAQSFSFDGDRAFLGEGDRGKRLRVLDLDTLEKRSVARYTGGTVDVSPDGTKLVSSGNRGGTPTVIDMSVSPASVTARPLGPHQSGRALWIDDDTVVYLAGGYDNSRARVFSAALQPIRTLEGVWYTYANVILDGTAYGLGWDGALFRAELPSGTAEVLREFPTPELYSLVAVEDEIHTEP